ncbi:MAG: glycosyl hydrolase [Bacteroidetes bacterium]|nr:glycosyl hydrolase [Bacteroidota bacterium]
MKIKLLLFSFFLAVLTGCSDVADNKLENPEFNLFNKLKITQIRPHGWIKTFLERQKEGLTGNIEVAGYPFDTKMWACEKIKGSTKAWWPYEQSSYYIDGAHRLALLLNDKKLEAKVKLQTQYVLDHINPETGRISTNLADRWWRWPYAQFFRNFMTEYELTGDRKIIEALQKHYLTFKAEDFADDLELANIEEICWLYGITKNERLLDMAVEAYRLFKSDISYRNRSEGENKNDMQFGSDRVPDMHGVVYLELVKIPAILYSYTGKREYLEEAENGIRKMEEHHMLISGLPSSTEHFRGISDLAGHETCNTAVFPYSYGYLLRINGDAKLGDKIEKAVFNAGIGSVTKDFKSHQYFSSPNQIISSLKSNLYGHNPARMIYAPGHDVECCTGNVNRFMPYYVEQMWLSSPGNGLVAALFGPSSVTANVGINKDEIRIIEETDYPFSEEINFKIETKEKVSFPFFIRIPTWCTTPEIFINGEKTNLDIKQGAFTVLVREFLNGDIITLKIPGDIKISSWPNNEIGVEKGPLVLVYP